MEFGTYITPFCAYFEEGFHPLFQDKYNGVIVNAINDFGEGHFAIRKPRDRFYESLPKFIKKLFPRKSVMYKNRSEKLYQLRFCDEEFTIEIVADMKNPSCKKLNFDMDTYLDLKHTLPDFLEKVGFKFDVAYDKGSNMSLVFE